jgi:hypothetical protein
MARVPFGLTYGEPVVVTIGAPGAGVQGTTTLVAGFNYKPIHFSYTLTTDATAVNRLMGIATTISGQQFVIRHNITVVASQVWVVEFAGGGGGAGSGLAGTTNGCSFPMWADMIIPGGSVFQTLVSNLQAGDAITNIALLLQRFTL